MAKVSFNPVLGNSYFSSGFLSIGVVFFDDKALIIDSGGDDDCAKSISQALTEAGKSIEAIINTHCHPDHCGGNAYFQKQYPHIQIYATFDEQRYIEDPRLAPRCFCALASPFQGLQNKYIAPQKSCYVTDVLTSYVDQKITILDKEFTIVTLPGHTPGMIGVISPDSIFYAGDALFGHETFNKHRVLFYTDIKSTLETFKKIKKLDVDKSVLYHGGVVNNLAEIVELHEVRIDETQAIIHDFLKNNPLSVDELTQKIMQKYAIPNTIVSFTLTQTTMRAYLAFLESNKQIELAVRNGLLVAVGI